MVETILKCTSLFVENEGNCVWVFPFFKPDTLYKQLLNLSVKEQLLPIPRHQNGALKFTDSAPFFLLHRMVLSQL